MTDTLSGEELHWTSLVSPKLSMPDTPQTSELAATQGASAVTSTVKVLPVGSLGKFSVTEEPGSAETEVPLGPVAAVMTKSVGAVNVRLTRCLVRVIVRHLEGIDVARPGTGGRRISGGSDDVAIGAARARVCRLGGRCEEGDTGDESAEHRTSARNGRNAICGSWQAPLSWNAYRQDDVAQAPHGPSNREA